MVADVTRDPLEQIRPWDRSRAEEWDSAQDALYRDALESEELDAQAAGAEWVVALDDWERWARIERFGSPSLFLLSREL